MALILFEEYAFLKHFKLEHIHTTKFTNMSCMSHLYVNGVHYIYKVVADQRVDTGCDRSGIVYVCYHEKNIVNKPQTMQMLSTNCYHVSKVCYMCEVPTTKLYTWWWPIRLKHVMYVYKNEKKSKNQLKLNAHGKSHTEDQIYTVQQDSAIQYHGYRNYWQSLNSKFMWQPCECGCFHWANIFYIPYILISVVQWSCTVHLLPILSKRYALRALTKTQNFIFWDIFSESNSAFLKSHIHSICESDKNIVQRYGA
jgi:hypothetical protein